MSELDIPDVALIDNTSQRLPCVLLLDGSGSMDGDPINELNAGLRILEEELKKDDVASQRVQLLVIRFGGETVEVLSDWTDAMDFSAPQVIASGRTPMGQAVRTGLAKLEEQKARYRANGVPFNRPWVFLITDGGPTDSGWPAAAAECLAAEQASKLVFFGIGVGPEADLSTLQQFSARRPVLMQGLKFRELFVWLSKSTSSASKAAPGAKVQLAPPTDWGDISA